MSRWTEYVWQALAALGATEYPYLYPYSAPGGGVPAPRDLTVDLADDATVRAIFQTMVEREWGGATGG